MLDDKKPGESDDRNVSSDFDKLNVKSNDKKSSVKWVSSPHSQFILGLVSYSESVIAPVVTDPFLVAIILADRARWIRYTVITILTSVLGGVTAYILGAVFFDVFGVWLIDILQGEDVFAEVTERLADNGFLFVILGALTPIPYKLVALASGFGMLPLVVFILASFIGRSVRFFITGYLSYAFGPAAIELFRYRLHAILYTLLALGLLYMAWKVLM